MNREDGHKSRRPDSEVKTPRRRFSAKEKLRILEEADACTEPGEIGALVRREGIYSSYLSRWRRARDSGQLNGLGGKKRGPKRTLDQELADENVALRRENDLLRARLEQAETIIEVQKKLSQMLGLATSARESTERG
ncbi:MAG: transposase [Chloroflexota bacterium]|nr:transposase [Chloroflexota bacterium]